jgi:primase-polymerase (primpol)-like protein
MQRLQQNEAVTKLWNGDASGHEGDHSRADMASLTHLAFWCSKNQEQMETGSDPRD